MKILGWIRKDTPILCDKPKKIKDYLCLVIELKYWKGGKGGAKNLKSR